MVLTDSRIKFFAEQVGVGASELKNKLQELDRQFQEYSLQRDWMGCLIALKKQNRLLGSFPIESDSDEDDCVTVTLIQEVKTHLIEEMADIKDNKKAIDCRRMI